MLTAMAAKNTGRASGLVPEEGHDEHVNDEHTAMTGARDGSSRRRLLRPRLPEALLSWETASVSNWTTLGGL